MHHRMRYNHAGELRVPYLLYKQIKSKTFNYHFDLLMYFEVGLEENEDH